MSLLSVIIVNYRSGDLLQSCLTSLLSSDIAVDDQIFVINNGTPEELASFRGADWPNLRLIQSPSNLGFGRAANKGYHSSQSEYVLLLNPDVRVEPQAVRVLLQTIQADLKAGIVLPKLKNPDGTLQYSCRRFYSYQTLLMRRGPWKNRFANHHLVRQHLMMDWDHNNLMAVDWGLGAAMMIRRSAAGRELFDERYFLYFEDVDLCFRIHENGWKVVYNPAAGMVHHHLRESAKAFSWRAKGYHFLSMMKFLWKQKLELREMRCDEKVD